jgi:hypothetical protein
MIAQEEKFNICNLCPFMKEIDERMTYCDKGKKSINWYFAHDDEHCPEGNW